MLILDGEGQFILASSSWNCVLPKGQSCRTAATVTLGAPGLVPCLLLTITLYNFIAGFM